jgi:hypothetical protein
MEGLRPGVSVALSEAAERSTAVVALDRSALAPANRPSSLFEAARLALVLCQRLVGQFALGTYKRAQFGTSKAALDIDPHHANFALGAARPLDHAREMTFQHLMRSHGQAGAQHSQSPITAEVGAVMMISDSGNAFGIGRKSVTSDTLARHLALRPEGPGKPKERTQKERPPALPQAAQVQGGTPNKGSDSGAGLGGAIAYPKLKTIAISGSIGRRVHGMIRWFMPPLL